MITSWDSTASLEVLKYCWNIAQYIIASLIPRLGLGCRVMASERVVWANVLSMMSRRIIDDIFGAAGFTDGCDVGTEEGKEEGRPTG